MSTTLTRNLKLKIDSNLTANSKYNLERIDTLGSTFLVDTTSQLNIRSKSDILIEPNSADVGGSGTGGTLSLGTANHSLGSVTVYASQFNTSNIGLIDQASGGTRSLLLRYKSDISGSVDTTADRAVYLDVNGADRNLVLGGDLSVTGGSLTLALSGATSLVLPLTGTLSTLAGTELLTNKSIDAATNTLTNISNSSISNSAAISYSKLSLSGSLVNADISASAGIVYSKLSIVNSVLDSDISSSAAIQRSKLAAGTANQVLINDGTGLVTSEAVLAKSRGGAGADMSAVSFPSSGVLATDSGTLTLTNKTISGASNTLTGISYGSLSLTGSILNSDVSGSAAIAYSKLNLSGGITNTDVNSAANIAYSKLNLASSIADADVSNSAAISYSKLSLTGHITNSDVSSSAAIAGTKISPDFGNQTVRTLAGIQFEEGGYTTDFRAAQSGQSTNLDFQLPNNAGVNGQVLATDGSGSLDWVTVAGTGTVTSVALTADPIFTVSGSPVTTAGTLDLALTDQSANTFLAGPSSGPAAPPAFRALTAADLGAVVGYRGMTSAWSSGTSISISHNWGTVRVLVEVLDNANNYATIEMSSVTRPDTNTVLLTSTAAPASAWTVLLKEVP